MSTKTIKKTPTLQWALAKDLIQRSYEELSNPPKGVMIPRLSTLTRYLGGLRPSELTLLCAATGAGKTALMATLASEVAIQGIPTFAAPVETGDVDFFSRMVSSLSKKELNIGESIPEEELKSAFSDGGFKLSNSPIWIANYDNRVHIDEMIAVLGEMSKKGVRVAFLDNLHFFLEVTSAEYERVVLDDAIHKLVMFCKAHPMHIVLIVHPRKTDGGRVMSEFDIKGSSTAVQECANVALFNRPTQEDLEKGRHLNDRELVFKKIRKRGMYVNYPIWITYANGGYFECR